MTSYFAQLMRSTGLAPGLGTRTAGRGGAGDSVSSAMPFHLEQVTLAEAPQADASRSESLPPSLASSPSGEAHHRSSMPGEAEAPINQVNETTGSRRSMPPGPVPPALTASLPPQSPSQPVLESNRERGESEQVASEESNLGPGIASHFLIEEHLEDRASRVEGTLELLQRDEHSEDVDSVTMDTRGLIRESDYPEAVAHLDAELIEEGSRANTYQSVLMAVKEWVSPTPVINQEDAIDESTPEGRWGSQSLLADLEDAASHTARHESESSRGPDLQDISLSVGTISIVIEEPARDFYAQPAAVRAESRTETPAPSPSLSRYYLRVR
jgi:hypothetical protein